MRPAGKARRARIPGVFERGATQPAPGPPTRQPRWGGGGMQRRPNAAGLSPRAATLRAEVSMRTWRAAIVFALVGGSIAAPSPSGAQTIVVKAARLIDGRGGPPLEPAMVRITGERIAEVAATMAVPAGATLIDLGSATLLPGLIDLHTHLTDRHD